MHKQISPLQKLGVTVAMTLGLTLIPVSLNTQEPLGVNDACADGQCCVELGSWCGDLAGYYDSLDKCNYQPGSGW